MSRTETVRWDFAAWTSLIPESEIRRLLKYQVTYYFGGGLPGVLPIHTFSKILRTLADDHEKMMDSREPDQMLQAIQDWNYGPTGGHRFFRETLARRLREKDGLDWLDPETGWEDVIVTTGSQQAIYSILDIMVDPGDVIIVPRPAYLGFLGPAVKLGARILSIETDLEGITPEDFHKAIRLSMQEWDRTPKILYLVADSDNPKGTTLPEKRRKAIFDIAGQHNILIIEDAAYREIQYGDVPPPIKSYDRDNELVCYLRTSSKEAAVLRMGYSVIPTALSDNVTKALGYLDLCPTTLNQRILDNYYSQYIDEALPVTLEKYKRRRDTMAKAIDESFPAGSRTDPNGGFFFWWQSEDKDFDTKKFLNDVAIPNDVLFVPSAAFYPIQGRAVVDDEIGPNIREINGMRLGFSFCVPSNITTGMTRLGKLLSDNIG